MPIRFTNVSFGYPAQPGLVLDEFSAHFPGGWTGVVGANGAGKSTLLELAVGLLDPVRGHIQTDDGAILCPQRTDEAPALLPRLLSSTQGRAQKLRGQLALAGDGPERWATLSHGERKRAQIAVALWCEPPILALDEPTNHIDRQTRSLLLDALSSYRGVGLLVSHDRDLLDALCDQCVFMEPPRAVVRPGGFTKGSAEAQREETASSRERDAVRKHQAKLKREVSHRRKEASQADRRRSKRGLAPGDHDGRDRINRARNTGRDAVAGKLLRQLEGRMEQADAAARALQGKRTHDLGIWLPGARSQRTLLFDIAAGSLSLGAQRRLHHPRLSMRPDERVALIGSNGCGKSTLIHHILDELRLEPALLTYLPQEIDLGATAAIMDQVRHLPNDQLGQAMSLVSRLNSRPERLLSSTTPTPGEIRKVLLALGIARVPHLIVMDEPTNHLDLPSIECLEEALAGCPCGLLLVSHDYRFLDRLVTTCWEVMPDGPDCRLTSGPWDGAASLRS